jgi:glycosyltransferase involved in cell wall biosynthesis
VAFFHPYCNAGGGGERVLWCAIAALAGTRDVRNLKVVVYCGDDPSKTSVDSSLEDARRRFGITIPPELDVEFVFVKRRHLLEPQRYKRFTMLGQSLGSMILAWECLRSCNPDVFIDTTGYAFTFILAKLFAGCLVACYVHYPTITTDMLAAVQERRPSYNNTDAVSGSVTATNAKLAYYRLFAAAYRFAGGFADSIMVNSTWTKNHLVGLWRLPGYRDPSSAVISKRGQGLAPAKVGASEGVDSRQSKRGGQPAPSPRISYGDSSEKNSPAKLEGDAEADEDGKEVAHGLSRGSSSADSSGLSLSSAGDAEDGLTYYRPVTGIVASLVRASGISPWLVPFPSLLLGTSSSAGNSGSGSESSFFLVSNDPVVEASRPLSSPRQRAAAEAEASSFSARMLLERPAARVVYPPCNTDALASMPLGWAYGSGNTARATPATAAGAGSTAKNSSAAKSREEPTNEGSIITPRRPQIITGNSPPDPTAVISTPAATTSALASSKSFITTRQRIVVSVAQFRPEKDHALQIRSFADFVRRDPARFGDVKLVLIGGVRDEGDKERLAALKRLAESEELALPKGSVEFRTNIPLSDLRKALGSAVAGLHSMWNEHFGIGVVEMMAAGVVTVAHNSGGPKSDIIVPHCGVRTGFLAATPSQYADCLETIFRPLSGGRPGTADEGTSGGSSARSSSSTSTAMVSFDPVAMTTAARASVTSRFSDEEFSLCFFAVMAGILQDGLEAAAKRRAASGFDVIGSSGSPRPGSGRISGSSADATGSSSKLD